MVAEPVRIGSVYETPRVCLPCGSTFTPPRRTDGRILDFCSDACRLVSSRRLNGVFSTLSDHVSSTVEHDTPVLERKLRPARPEHQVDLAALARSRIRYPEAIPPFGLLMMQMRRKYGWTQQDLAHRLQVHPNSVAGWEVGRNEPTVSKFAAIAQLFEITMDALFRGSVEEGSPNDPQ